MRQTIPDDLRARVIQRDGYQCRYCGNQAGAFHLDHVYPVARGGETSYENLVMACAPCNTAKQARVGIWPKPPEYFKPKPNLAVRHAWIHAITLGIAMTGFILMAATKNPAYIVPVCFGAGGNLMNCLYLQEHLDAPER